MSFLLTRLYSQLPLQEKEQQLREKAQAMVLTREKQNKALQDFAQRQENNAQTRSSLSVDTD